MDRSFLSKFKRVVVKVGTNSLTDEKGRISKEKCQKIVDDIYALISSGKEVILVTSGAVGAGSGRLGLTEKPKTLPQKQACAAIGQTLLMQMYEQLFSRYNQIVAQVLLTRNDITHRSGYLNARNTLTTLLQYKALPIINENDTVAVEELRGATRFGDNDTLSALVSSLIEAEVLIILTDVQGLYDDNPKTNPAAKLLERVERITPAIESKAGQAGSQFSTGGMVTKLKAARIAMQSGVHMILAKSDEPSVLKRIMAGENLGTLFIPVKNPLSGKKRWIAYGRASMGSLMIDNGACEALIKKGRSLLPSGIINIEGDFNSGDLVTIIDENKKELGRGLVNYDSDDIRKIAGHQTAEIEKILGYGDYEEVIHRDNMVCLKEDCHDDTRTS